jgi:O-antigen/teichoic acid export membrane protein
MEVVYWTLGAALAVVLGWVALTSGPRWVQTETIPTATIALCLVLLSVRVAMSFPHSVYQSVFIGTERQVLGSALNACLALTSAAGAVIAVLVFRSVAAVFASEAIVAALYLAIFRVYAFRILPPGESRVQLSETRGLAGISVALMWTSGVGLILSSLDRVFVSATLPVASLAIYTVAVMGGRIITLFVNPVLQAVYPGMCRVSSGGSIEQQGQHLLHTAAMILLVAAGIGIPLCGFTREALALWVKDQSIVGPGAPIMAVYLVGSMLIALASVFYQWQTATGHTGPAVKFNALALLWFPLALWMLVSRFGLLGAALSWTIYGALAWITTLAATFGPRRLPSPVMHAYFRSGLVAVVPAVLCTMAARIAANTWFADSVVGRAACGVTAAMIAAGVAAVVLLPHLRHGTAQSVQASPALP